MPALVRAAVAGDTPRVTLIADHITLMTGILTRHHSGEDKHIWPDLLHGVARVLLGAEQPAGLGQQRRSRLGERDAGGVPREQCQAQFPLRLLDGGRDCGLGYVHPASALGEAALLGDGDEVLKLAKLHRYRH
jgi:hypothetical protein